MTKSERAALDAVANALQTASPLATELRRTIGGQIDVAVKLEGALDRAVRALRELQPGGKERRP